MCAAQEAMRFAERLVLPVDFTTRSTMTFRTAKIITISLAMAALTGCVATMPDASVGQRDAITPESLQRMKVPRLSGTSVLMGYLAKGSESQARTMNCLCN